MLTGFHGLMVGMYESLNDDRFSRPGALTFRWNERRRLRPRLRQPRRVDPPQRAAVAVRAVPVRAQLDLHGLQHVRHEHACSATTGCTARATSTTSEDRLRRSYETEFLRPDGRIIGVRSSHLGLSWNLWAGSSIQLTTAYWMHAALPDIAQRTWWLLREHAAPSATAS